MALTWLEHSEIVFGLILSGKLSLTTVRPELFHVPYNDGVKLLKNGEPKENVVSAIGLDAYQTAVQAAETLNGSSNLSWSEMLEKSSIYYDAGNRLEKFSKKLQRGEDIDWLQITGIANKAQRNISSGLIPANKIEGKEVPFIKSGWQIFDEHIGGFPEVGMVIVGGNPKVGKTYTLTKWAASFVREHPKKKVAVFELEQKDYEIVERLLRTEKLTDEELSRIEISDEILSIDQILNRCALVENLGLVMIDYIDWLVPGEISEPVMSGIYKSAAAGSKQLNCPLVMFAQLSGYEKGIPKPQHLRWTRLAFGLGWMVCMLYDPARDTHEFSDDEDERLPNLPNTAYVICWGIKGGFRQHLEDNPGAIAISFRGDKGWSSTKGRWFSLKKS